MVLRKVTAKINRFLKDDPFSFRIDDNGSKRLGGRIETEEHAESFVGCGVGDKGEEMGALHEVISHEA